MAVCINFYPPFPEPVHSDILLAPCAGIKESTKAFLSCFVRWRHGYSHHATATAGDFPAQQLKDTPVVVTSGCHHLNFFFGSSHCDKTYYIGVVIQKKILSLLFSTLVCQIHVIYSFCKVFNVPTLNFELFFTFNVPKYSSVSRTYNLKFSRSEEIKF